MTDNFIQLNKSDTLKLGIKDSDGNPTGEYLEFDLEDIELPLKYQELIEEDKKATRYLRDNLIAIDKKQDVKGKKILSKNQEDKIRLFNEYYRKEEQILNGFLGENGVSKLLGGRKLGWTSLDEIGKIIKEQIEPHLNVNMDNITKKVKAKYGNLTNDGGDTLTNE